MELTFSSPTLTKAATPRRRKRTTPIVNTVVRRCTRSTIKRDGFKAGTFAELPLDPKRKKPKTKPIPVVLEAIAEGQAQGPAQEEVPVVPPTPIKVLQSIGVDLQIDHVLLTKEKLMATPSSSMAPHEDDDV